MEQYNFFDMIYLSTFMFCFSGRATEMLCDRMNIIKYLSAFCYSAIFSVYCFDIT